VVLLAVVAVVAVVEVVARVLEAEAALEALRVLGLGEGGPVTAARGAMTGTVVVAEGKDTLIGEPVVLIEPVVELLCAWADNFVGLVSKGACESGESGRDGKGMGARVLLRGDPGIAAMVAAADFFGEVVLDSDFGGG
jgi:hypothetical protein